MRVAPALLAFASLAAAACSPTEVRLPVAPAGNYPPMVAAPPVNATAVQSLQGRVACAPREVAPGVFASFDCAPHRDVLHAIAPTMRMSFVTGPLPPFVDHRLTGLEGPVKNQGAVGTCTAMSLSTAMDHAVRKMGRADVVGAPRLVQICSLEHRSRRRPDGGGAHRPRGRVAVRPREGVQAPPRALRFLRQSVRRHLRLRRDRRPAPRRAKRRRRGRPIPHHRDSAAPLAPRRRGRDGRGARGR